MDTLDEAPKIILPKYDNLKEIIEFLNSFRIPDQNIGIGIKTWCNSCHHHHHYRGRLGTFDISGRCNGTRGIRGHDCRCTIGETPSYFRLMIEE